MLGLFDTASTMCFHLLIAIRMWREFQPEYQCLWKTIAYLTFKWWYNL